MTPFFAIAGYHRVQIRGRRLYADPCSHSGYFVPTWRRNQSRAAAKRADGKGGESHYSETIPRRTHSLSHESRWPIRNRRTSGKL